MPHQTYFLRTTKPTPLDASLEDRFRSAVSNTGNYFFEEALQQHLEDIEVVFSFAELPEKFDTLVLSMSNFLSPSTDLGPLCDQLNNLDISRIVMVGAGAQANDYDEELTITEGTLKFIRLLSEKSTSIGIRGYYTEDFLKKINIKNVEVIGCPTAFWVNRIPVKETDDTLHRLAVHCTPSGYYRDKIGALFQHAIKHDANYIVQSEKWMMPLIAENFSGQREELRTDGQIAYYSKASFPPNEFEGWINKKALIYFGMEEWIGAMKGFDFVYGSRFHGNMAALQAGTPALNMPFDTRTRELCEYLNLPHIPLTSFYADMSPLQLRHEADFSLYNKTYNSRLNSYREFLERNGLKTRNLQQDSTEKASSEKIIMGASLSKLATDFAFGSLTEEEFLNAAALRIRKERTPEVRAMAEQGRFDLL